MDNDLVNEEAERSLLGTMLMQPQETVANTIATLTSEMFFHEKHRLIHSAIVSMYKDRKEIDLVTVADELRKRGELQKVGHTVYLLQLSNEIISPSHAERYALIVHELHIRRSQSFFHRQRSVEYTRLGNDVFSLLDDDSKRTSEVLQGAAHSDIESLGALIPSTIKEVQWYQDNGGSPGITTGFKDLDANLGGFAPGNLVIIAARPSLGKSALMQCMQLRQAKQKIPTLAASYEMSKKDMVKRAIVMHGGIDAQRMKMNRLWREELERLPAIEEELRDLPFYVHESPDLGLSGLTLSIRRAVDKYGVRVAYVDYLQLVPPDSNERNREQQVAKISRALKQLAMKQEIAVVALSQLSREIEKRKNPKPIMSDLRESGAIEQDADDIIFIHRTKEDSMLIIGKQRNGITTDVPIKWEGKHIRFEDAQFKMPYGVQQPLGCEESEQIDDPKF